MKRFSLLTLFVATTACCFAAGWFSDLKSSAVAEMQVRMLSQERRGTPEAIQNQVAKPIVYVSNGAKQYVQCNSRADVKKIFRSLDWEDRSIGLVIEYPCSNLWIKYVNECFVVAANDLEFIAVPDNQNRVLAITLNYFENNDQWRIDQGWHFSKGSRDDVE